MGARGGMAGSRERAARDDGGWAVDDNGYSAISGRTSPAPNPDWSPGTSANGLDSSASTTTEGAFTLVIAKADASAGIVAPVLIFTNATFESAE